jgi:hypothetical protein
VLTLVTNSLKNDLQHQNQVRATRGHARRPHRATDTTRARSPPNGGPTDWQKAAGEGRTRGDDEREHGSRRLAISHSLGLRASVSVVCRAVSPPVRRAPAVCGGHARDTAVHRRTLAHRGGQPSDRRHGPHPRARR